MWRGRRTRSVPPSSHAPPRGGATQDWHGVPPNATTAKAAGHAARAGDKALEQCGNVATNSDVAAGMGSDEVGESEELRWWQPARPRALPVRTGDQIAGAGPLARADQKTAESAARAGEWGSALRFTGPDGYPPLLTGLTTWTAVDQAL